MNTIDMAQLNKHFSNKIVSFNTNSEETLAIKNPVVESQLGKLFLVGLIPKGSTVNDWAYNRSCALLWESVTGYIIFDSEEQYVELLKKSSTD